MINKLKGLKNFLERIANIKIKQNKYQALAYILNILIWRNYTALIIFETPLKSGWMGSIFMLITQLKSFMVLL
jgi:hypothetical protein